MLAVVLLSACGHGARGKRVYISNEADGTISVIDLATHNVTATIPVGKRPRGLHVSKDGRWLYVALSGSPRSGPDSDSATLPQADRAADGIGLIDLQELAFVRTINSGQDPEAFDLVGDDQLVVSNEETAEASLVDVSKGVVHARVPVGHEPEGVATTPDGKYVFVTSEADDKISVIDPRSAKVVASMPTGHRPRGVAFSRDGAIAYVTNENDGTISILDARAFGVLDSFVLPHDGSTPAGPRPMGVAIDGSGLVYVTTGRGGSVIVSEPRAHQVVRVISDVGKRPWGIALAPDGNLYTANGPSDDVSVIEPSTGRVVARVPVGGGPWGVASDR